MTKDWENYKRTILALYEHQTLSQVMEIMERDYNFSASTRAYRQKLDKWGKRKYKKRKDKSGNGSEDSGADSADEAADSSISASPEVSRRRGDAHAYQRQQQQSASTGGYGADAATYQTGDGSYALHHSGTDVSNNYNPAQYQNANAYGATDNNTYWANYSATAAQSYSQAPPDPNAAAYGYGGISYPTDNTAAASFQYMDASGASYSMDNQMDYNATYPGGSWDQTQDG
ncbi:uncharacterized protein PG986_012259 [Apiospora aurea]|uniref:Clr5 domain-containing protein n=1 Tax=Apiospora aurea TaxID=335848 RepID=A0ABR1Q0M4_9PEZI